MEANLENNQNARVWRFARPINFTKVSIARHKYTSTELSCRCTIYNNIYIPYASILCVKRTWNMTCFFVDCFVYNNNKHWRDRVRIRHFFHSFIYFFYFFIHFHNVIYSGINNAYVSLLLRRYSRALLSRVMTSLL